MGNTLLTGMTAGHTSKNANERSLTFAGVINQTLTAAGHDVTWADPDINWTQDMLDKFDAVIVGIAPITSLAANRAYGALNIIETMYDSSKLTLYIDAPMPQLITASLSSIERGQTDLVKPFFSYRKQYALAASDPQRARLESAIHRLYADPWPTTIYPMLPWEAEPLAKGLPEGAGGLFGVNLDAVLLSDGPVPEYERDQVWAIDSYRTRWAITTAKSVVLPTTPMRPDKTTTDWDVEQLMASTIGTMISPQKTGGTWWSYRYVQALRTGSPVVTEWRDSGILGSAWSFLPARIETLSDTDRLSLAQDQKDTYLSAINDRVTATAELETLLELDNHRG